MFVITISWVSPGDRSSFEKKVTLRIEGPDGVNGAVYVDTTLPSMAYCVVGCPATSLGSRVPKT